MHMFIALLLTSEKPSVIMPVTSSTTAAESSATLILFRIIFFLSAAFHMKTSGAISFETNVSIHREKFRRFSPMILYLYTSHIEDLREKFRRFSPMQSFYSQIIFQASGYFFMLYRIFL